MPASKTKKTQRKRPMNELAQKKLAQKKDAFIVAYTSTRGSLHAAKALLRDNGFSFDDHAIYRWREEDPDFAARMDEAACKLDASLQVEAIRVIKAGMISPDPKIRIKSAELACKVAHVFDDRTVVNVNQQFVSLAQALNERENAKTDVKPSTQSTQFSAILAEKG